MIERLKNCPNCAGVIDDVGRCKYCGAKIYDFLSLDFDGYKPTYIRIRTREGRIVIMPIRFVNCSVTAVPITADFECEGRFVHKIERMEEKMEMEAYVVGDIVYEKEEE